MMQRKYKAAQATWETNTLTVTTGKMQRIWALTDAGLATREVKNIASDHTWAMLPDAAGCDWELPGVSPEGHRKCRLEAIRMHESDDEGFTTRHLAVELDLYYPGTSMRVRFTVWAYPDAPGLRTRLWLQPGSMRRVYHTDSTGRVECLPLDLRNASLHAAGYYNCTQSRNKPETPLIREWTSETQPESSEIVDWASLADVRLDGEAIAIVKESHKCVNQGGKDTGDFRFDPKSGFSSTGWGLAEARLDPFDLHPAWAHWCVCSSDDDFALQEAVKDFDRHRFHTDPQRDVYMISNTWGSRGAPEGPLSMREGRGSRDAAKEDNVLREIDVA
ncbi:MAG: hypothetical protein ACOC29_03805, partial [Candidatus Sumerlaeota bacterium]